MDCGFEAVIERQLNYSKVVFVCVCVCVCACGGMWRVCVHVCNKMGLDMESHHTKRDNQIMIKTKQMVT